MEPITFDNIISFLRTAMRWIQMGGKFVPYEEAERRAAICRTCPANHGAARRGACPECFARRAVKFIADQLKDRRFENLTYCEHCGCDLNLKVNLPLEALQTNGYDYPEHCWQRDARSDQTVS